MASVIDALKRLERAGAEDSAHTLKLRQAAAALAEHLVQQIRAERTLNLPRGYEVDDKQLWLCGDLQPLNPFLPSREQSMDFASSIATGWLDELATWLEERARVSKEATNVIQEGDKAAFLKQRACDARGMVDALSTNNIPTEVRLLIGNSDYDDIPVNVCKTRIAARLPVGWGVEIVNDLYPGEMPPGSVWLGKLVNRNGEFTIYAGPSDTPGQGPTR